MQASDDRAPTPAVEVPAGQATQADDAAEVEYEPTGHCAQGSSPLGKEKLPASHITFTSETNQGMRLPRHSDSARAPSDAVEVPSVHLTQEVE